MIKRHLYLNQIQVKKLEKESDEKQIKISELVRRILDAHFDKKENK